MMQDEQPVVLGRTFRRRRPTPVVWLFVLSICLAAGTAAFRYLGHWVATGAATSLWLWVEMTGTGSAGWLNCFAKGTRPPLSLPA